MLCHCLGQPLGQEAALQLPQGSHPCPIEDEAPAKQHDSSQHLRGKADCALAAGGPVNFQVPVSAASTKRQIPPTSKPGLQAYGPSSTSHTPPRPPTPRIPAAHYHHHHQAWLPLAANSRSPALPAPAPPHPHPPSAPGPAPLGPAPPGRTRQQSGRGSLLPGAAMPAQPSPFLALRSARREDVIPRAEAASEKCASSRQAAGRVGAARPVAGGNRSCGNAAAAADGRARTAPGGGRPPPPAGGGATGGCRLRALPDATPAKGGRGPGPQGERGLGGGECGRRLTGRGIGGRGGEASRSGRAGGDVAPWGWGGREPPSPSFLRACLRAFLTPGACLCGAHCVRARSPGASAPAGGSRGRLRAAEGGRVSFEVPR